MTALWRKIKKVDVNTFDNYLCIQLVLPDNPWKAVVIPNELRAKLMQRQASVGNWLYLVENYLRRKLHIARACVLTSVLLNSQLPDAHMC